MTTLEIVLIIIVSVMLAIPPLGNLAVAMLRHAGKERAALWLEGAIPLAVRVMKVALTVGTAVAAKTNAASLLEESDENERPTDPPSPPPLPFVGGTMLLCLAVALAGCGASPLQVASDVANGVAAAGTAAAPIITEVCVEPMREALVAHDVAMGRAIADRCDVPIAAYDLVRRLHVALRADVVAIASGRVPTGTAALVAEAVDAAAALSAAIAKLGGAR